jgi:hypothetical protein
MKTISATTIRGVLAVGVLALSVTACDVKKTQEGEMPKVSVEGGQVPKYDVEGPDVKVEGEKKTITVPDVDVVTPQEKRQGGNVEPGDTKPEGTTTPPPPAPPADPAPPATPPAP